MMSWLDTLVSFYSTHTDVIGRPSTFRQILLSEFSNYMHILQALKRNIDDAEKRRLKSLLGCYALNLLENRKGEVLNRSGLIQFDFDYEGIKDYDIDELQQALFDLPFVAFCGKSCSGKGLFVLAMIAEPEKQKEYVEHCFDIFFKNNLPVDTSKGRKVNDLRYVSYDSNMLIRDNPIPLKIRRFKPPTVAKKPTNYIRSNNHTGLIKWATDQIQSAQVGQRFETVRKVSYAMGGHDAGLEEIKQIINCCSQFAGVESKYLQHADEAFAAGKLKPIL